MYKRLVYIFVGKIKIKYCHNNFLALCRYSLDCIKIRSRNAVSVKSRCLGQSFKSRTHIYHI